MTAFELFLPDWWLVINSSILLKRVPHYHPNISPSREKLRSQARQDFCTPASQACQIKRVCQWHFEDGSPKNGEKKDELCKISLNIALQRKCVPHAHRFQPQTSIGMHSRWHNTAEVNSSPLFLFPVITASSAELGFLREKLRGDKGERRRSQGDWMRSAFRKWTWITSGVLGRWPGFWEV